MAPTRRNSPRRRPSPVATPHVDLEYPSSVPTFTVNPTQLSAAQGGNGLGGGPLPWFSAFGREDNEAPLPNAIDPKYSDPAYYASSNAYGRNGRNSSHTAKKPAGHIKRPPNCFLLFRSHVKESGTRIPDELRPLIKKRLADKKKKDRVKKGGADDDEEDTDDDDDEENDEDEQSVSKISGILWDFLPPKEKSFFRARAAHAKAQHKRLFPDYKYSPQAKDKNVKKRTGKKMAVEKRQRLEEVAGVLVQNMGWASASSSSSAAVKREQQSHARSPSPGPSSSVPGTGAFSVPEYEHQPPAAYSNNSGKPRSVPSTPTPHDASGVPMSLGQFAPVPYTNYTFPPPQQQPSSHVEQYHQYQQPHAYGDAAGGGAEQPRMHRRTSSCPPPNAHLTWANAQQEQQQLQQQQGLPLPHAYGQQPVPQQQFAQGWGFPQHHQQASYDGFTSQHAAAPSNNFAFPAAPSAPPPLVQQQQPRPPINGTFVRPGGKTIRKMRSGAPTAKQQLLNGGANNAGNGNRERSRSTSKGANKKQAENFSNANAGGMMLPSLPTVMQSLAPQHPQQSQQQLIAGMVPMSTAGSQDESSSSSMGSGQWSSGLPNYDLSQHSSPATFSSSSNSNAPSVLETPPLQQHLPQLAYSTQFDFSGTMAGQQQQYGMYNQDQQLQFHAPTPESEAYSTPKAGSDHQEDGNLGLTFIEPSYTFPAPPAVGSPAETVRAASPAKSNSVPQPQPQRATSGRWTNKAQTNPLVKSPYPTSGRKVPRLQMAASASAPSPSDAGSPFPAPPFTPLSPSSVVSPTPVTPIPGHFHQQKPQQYHPHPSPHTQALEQPMRQMGLEDLGVELNLNLPPGTDPAEMDPEHLGGLLEYAFPSGGSGHEYMNSVNIGVNGDGLLQEGFTLGAAGGNVLLGDAALGMHEQQEQYEDYQQDGQHQHHHLQQYLPVQQHSEGAPFVPLHVPLEALYEGAPGAAGPVMETVSFDPSLFIEEGHDLSLSEEVDLSAATAEESQLEFQMMEWRRGSGGSTKTIMASGGPNMSRRASIGIGATLGSDAGANLYGYHPDNSTHQDAPTPHGNSNAAEGHNQGLRGMNVGWDFEFQPQSEQQLQEFSQDGYSYNHGSYPAGSFNGQMYHHSNYHSSTGSQGPLNLETVVERGSSEEADDNGKRYQENWVASHA
ncbi:hypothetical protein FRB93_007817 [Tulasnella sp. JGI-2019a]|nr:hypothetical protein FRB93_007817 [Tulasnella sp. JGI-2019a]